MPLMIVGCGSGEGVSTSGRDDRRANGFVVYADTSFIKDGDIEFQLLAYNSALSYSEYKTSYSCEVRLTNNSSSPFSFPVRDYKLVRESTGEEFKSTTRAYTDSIDASETESYYLSFLNLDVTPD